MDSIFLSNGDESKTKGSVFWGDNDISSIITHVSVFIPLEGIALGNSWLGDISLKDYKNIWKVMVREIKTINMNNLIFRDFNYTMDKMDRDTGKKTKRLYRCGSNYALSNLTVDNWLEDL